MAVPISDIVIGKRFNLASAQTLEARLSGTAPIRFSRLTSFNADSGRSLTPPQENAFVIQMPLIGLGFSDLRFGSRNIPIPERQERGQPFLFDMTQRPTVRMCSNFDLMRFYVSQATIDELAYEKGQKRVGGLMQRSLGENDPTLFRIAQILALSMENAETVTAAFIEYMGLAFHDHVVRTYGGETQCTRPSDVRLAPWQIRRVTEFIEDNLEFNPTISELAKLCDLSASYFAQAFRQMMGMAPHQWVMRRRIERGKFLLKGSDSSLAAISASCGFFDQSHFSRVFMRFEGFSPRDWRKLNRDH